MPANDILRDANSREAKAELNCSEATYWKLINNRELEAYYVGTQIRITRESLDAYKERHRYVPRKELKGDKGSLLQARKKAAEVKTAAG